MAADEGKCAEREELLALARATAGEMKTYAYVSNDHYAEPIIDVLFKGRSQAEVYLAYIEWRVARGDGIYGGLLEEFDVAKLKRRFKPPKVNNRLFPYAEWFLEIVSEPTVYTVPELTDPGIKSSDKTQ